MSRLVRNKEENRNGASYSSSSSERLAGLLFCIVSIEINQGTSTAGKPQGRLDVLICLQKLFPWYACLGTDGSQSRSLDFAMVGQCDWSFCSISVLTDHSNMLSFSYQGKPEHFKCLYDFYFRSINREMGHERATPASATNASRTGESVSKISGPKVSR